MILLPFFVSVFALLTFELDKCPVDKCPVDKCPTTDPSPSQPATAAAAPGGRDTGKDRLQIKRQGCMYIRVYRNLVKLNLLN